MAQGILIAAYKEFDHLLEIVDFFDKGFEIYIHIDKKCVPSGAIMQEIRGREQVKFVSHAFHVNWGGINHLKCILLLAEEALKNKELSYIHLISGQDFPIKDLSYFDRFQHGYQGEDFLQHFKLPSPIWVGGGLRRVDYYNFYDLLDFRKYKLLIDLMVFLQMLFKLKRPLSKEVESLYGGAAWWSLTRTTLDYVVTYTHRNKYLLNRLKHTFGPDEIYFQTVIMNSKHAGGVVNDDLRFVDWMGPRNGSIPAVLDSTDFDRLKSSSALFARKFEHPVSDPLKAMLVKHWPKPP